MVTKVTLKELSERLVGMGRPGKQVLQVLVDAGAIVAALFASYWVNSVYLNLHALAEAVVLAAMVVLIMIASGAYRALVRYVSYGFSRQAVFGTIVAIAVLLALHLAYRQRLNIRIFTDFAVFGSIFLSLPRQLMRGIYEWLNRGQHSLVAIYGAGSVGRQLAMALKGNQTYRIYGFIDDDPALANTKILGLPVISADSLHSWIKAGVQDVLLAIPGAPIVRRRQIIAQLESLNLSVKTVPDMADLVSGRARLSELKRVEIDDLLGRDSVPPRPDLIERDILEKTVLVTGGGGSIGSELCRLAILHGAKKLVVLERSEHAMYLINEELKALAVSIGVHPEIVPVLSSVIDTERVRSVLRHHRVDTVYHAAAYKHVPLVECNAFAGIENNLFGTWIIATEAIAAGVTSLVMISTDKAVRPTNVMGASKRLAELAVQACAEAEKVPTTRLSIVRFGNVLGSSGSVVPLFRSQIAKGGPVTVTHPDVTRYFMTIGEAAELVVQAGAMGQRGEVFVLDMGESVKIFDLAERMIRLSGYRPITPTSPDGDIEILITGLRPGEKLYEELLLGDNTTSTTHPRISRSSEPTMSMKEYQVVLHALQRVLRERDIPKLRAMLYELPIAYMPSRDSVEDVAVSMTQHSSSP